MIRIPSDVVVCTNFPNGTGMGISDRGGEYVPSFESGTCHSTRRKEEGSSEGCEAREFHCVRNNTKRISCREKRCRGLSAMSSLLITNLYITSHYRLRAGPRTCIRRRAPGQFAVSAFALCKLTNQASPYAIIGGRAASYGYNRALPQADNICKIPSWRQIRGKTVVPERSRSWG